MEWQIVEAKKRWRNLDHLWINSGNPICGHPDIIASKSMIQYPNASISGQFEIRTLWYHDASIYIMMPQYISWCLNLWTFLQLDIKQCLQYASISGHSISGQSISGHSISRHSIYGHSISRHSIYGHSIYRHSIYGHPISGHMFHYLDTQYLDFLCPAIEFYLISEIQLS